MTDPAGMASAQLPLDWSVDKEHDLPPKWDGEPVEWEGWRPEPWTSAWFHSKERQVCERCGGQERPAINRGFVTHTEIGRSWPVIRFFAYRCPYCRLDTVHDAHTGEWWTLDSTDYGRFGSVSS